MPDGPSCWSSRLWTMEEDNGTIHSWNSVLTGWHTMAVVWRDWKRRLVWEGGGIGPHLQQDGSFCSAHGISGQTLIPVKGSQIFLSLKNSDQFAAGVAWEKVCRMTIHREDVDNMKTKNSQQLLAQKNRDRWNHEWPSNSWWNVSVSTKVVAWPTNFTTHRTI